MMAARGLRWRDTRETEVQAGWSKPEPVNTETAYFWMFPFNVSKLRLTTGN